MLQVLEVCRYWYNMCLAERKYAYQLEGRSVTKAEQERTAVRYRQTIRLAQPVFSQTLQSVCDQVDKALKAFFRRVKAGEAPGYPRFKGRDRFRSFLFKQYGAGAKIDGRRLRLYGIGRVAVRWHRPLQGTIKTVRIVHKGGAWYACFACELQAPTPLPQTGERIGIDVGAGMYAPSALLTTSDGAKVEHPAFYRKGQKALRRKQRKLARAKKGSKNRWKALRGVQRQQEHVANQRRDFLHKLSTDLVRCYDSIALEDLRVANMTRNHHLSKSILDSGWATFRQYLTYKAESAGRVVMAVNPAYTSKTCSCCGAIFEGMTLAMRWVECSCGLSMDRDHNAAKNILKRTRIQATGWDAPVLPNVGH